VLGVTQSFPPQANTNYNSYVAYPQYDVALKIIETHSKKLKVKLTPCMFKHHSMETYGGLEV
jgi:hypothetical protein